MRRAALLAVMLATSVSFAQTCTVGEYAQYKDKASNDAGLERMAVDYCLNRILGKFDTVYRKAPTTRISDACNSEMRKMEDAVAAAGRAQEFARMTADDGACQRTAAKVGAHIK